MKSKLIRDTGGGCSICGQRMTPPVNVGGTYWLCAECLLETLEEKRTAGWRAGVEAMRDALLGVYSTDLPDYKSFLDTLVTRLLAEGEGGKRHG